MTIWSVGSAVPRVEPPEADELVRAGRAVLVDYGEPHEWFAGHLPNALLVTTHFPVDRARLLKDRLVIVGSRQAGVAEDLVEELVREGYQAALLEGGQPAWEHAGLPLVLPDGEPRSARR